MNLRRAAAGAAGTCFARAKLPPSFSSARTRACLSVQPGSFRMKGLQRLCAKPRLTSLALLLSLCAGLDHVMTSAGVIAGDGTPLCAASGLFGDGGSRTGPGRVSGDGVITGDALPRGDDTSGMDAPRDGGNNFR